MVEFDRTTFLSGINAEFIAELYTRLLADPASVDERWRRFFAEVGDDASALEAERVGPAWARPLPPILNGPEAARRPAIIDGDTFRQAAVNSIRALQLIRAYRV